MRTTRTNFRWLSLSLLVVISGLAQPLRTSAAETTRAALWTAVDAALRRIEPAADPGHYTADSPANRLTFRFGPDAVEAAPSTRNGAWRWSLRLTGYGAPGAVRPVASPSVTASDYRIEYRRGAVTEWYDNRPEGLEQGFTLAAPPHRAGDSVVLALRVVGGLTSRLDPNAQLLSFHGPDGKAVLHYGKVTVSDARGRSLPARLELAGNAIDVRVNTHGAAWPVTVDPLVTGTPAEFTAREAESGDFMGCSVALAGDTALVGAAATPFAGKANAGVAYVFTRSGMDWNEQAKLALTNPVGGYFFGVSVALSSDGNTALVGANGRGSTKLGGAAYVFTRSGMNWTQQAELSYAPGGFFGLSVALSGDSNTALVGAPLGSPGRVQFAGAAYLFKRSGTSWTRQNLVAKAPTANGSFGGSVALSGDGSTALIGAPGMNVFGAVFVYSSTDWTSPQDTLAPADPKAGDRFGSSVALSGDTALASTPGRAAYVFTRSGTKWTPQQELLPSGTNGSSFASCPVPTCVALSGNIAVVGAPEGAVYVYQRSGTSWAQEAPLGKDVGQPFDQFGYAVAMSGNDALVGAPGSNKGYVYTFASVNGPTPFATFDVTQFFAAASAPSLSLTASFTLGPGSNGISPLTEPLTLRIGGLTTMIPAGGFTAVKEHQGKGAAQEILLYGGQTGDTSVEAQLIPMRQGKSRSYVFQIWESGGSVSLTNQRFVPIELTIGDDQGTSVAVH